MVMDKVKRLSHLKEPEERFAMTRVLDLTEKVLVNHEIGLTDFYDPHLLSLAGDILRGFPKLRFEFSGGYEEAERKRILLCQDYYEPVFADFNLGCVKIEATRDFERLNHRDFLGAILGMGLRREKVGDIIVGGDAAYCITTGELADYLNRNLTQVGQVAVRTSLLPNLEDGLSTWVKYKEIRTTVASLRLDSVSSHGFNVSRSQAGQDIKGGKVKLNWKETSDPGKEIKEGDVISYRGYGRVIVHKLIGNTKKGRIALLLHRLQ